MELEINRPGGDMFHLILARVRAVEERLRLLEDRVLEDRVSVIETNTIDHETRLQELEERLEDRDI